jgi:hypothetical protein
LFGVVKHHFGSRHIMNIVEFKMVVQTATKGLSLHWISGHDKVMGWLP